MKLGSRGDICTPIFIAVFMAIVKILSQRKSLAAGEWISKIQSLQIMGYFKRTGILIHAVREWR